MSETLNEEDSRARRFWSTLGVVRRRWWVVAVCALAFGVLTLGLSLLQVPKYESTATLYVTAPSDTNAASAAYQGSLASQQRVTSYVKLVTSDVVLTNAVTESALDITVDEARDALSANASVNTVLLSVSAVTADPVRSSVLANSVASSLSDYIKTLERPDGGMTPLAKVTVVSAATPPSAPSSPSIVRNTVAAVGVGGLLGILVVFAMARLDNRVRDEGDLAAAVGAPVLSAVPADKLLSESHVLDFSRGGSAAAEDFRRLRVNLSFVSVDSPVSTIVVTSASEGEGKTTVSLNLASALAESGEAVVLVDADLRRPMVASRLGLNGDVGVTDVLSGRLSIVDVVQRVESSGLSVITSGRSAPNPVELLGSRKAQDFLRQLRESFSYVIVDVPPVLPVTDAAVVSQYADGVLFVSRSGVASRHAVAEAAGLLRTANVRVLGALLNGSLGRASYYGNGYYGVHPEVARTVAD
ncbi:polysaccharide biosynthesis tyrosine autokinase [Gordonia terrae]